LVPNFRWTHPKTYFYLIFCCKKSFSIIFGGATLLTCSSHGHLGHKRCQTRAFKFRELNLILLMNLVVFCENCPLKSVSGTSKILNNTVNLWINYGYLKLSKEMVSWEQGELRELEHMIYFWKPVLLKKINLISEKGTFLRWTLFTAFAIKSSNVVNHQMLFKMHSLSNIFPFNNAY
jgi:hypothetical protein